MLSGQNSCKTFSSCSLSSLPRRRSFGSSRNPHQGTRDKALKTHTWEATVLSSDQTSWFRIVPLEKCYLRFTSPWLTELLVSFSPFSFLFFLFSFFFSFPFYRKSVECNLTDLSGISLSEVEEGNEPDEFWKAIGGKKYYCSLAHGKYVLPHPPPPFTSFFHF